MWGLRTTRRQEIRHAASILMHVSFTAAEEPNFGVDPALQWVRQSALEKYFLLTGQMHCV